MLEVVATRRLHAINSSYYDKYIARVLILETLEHLCITFVFASGKHNLYQLEIEQI